MRIQLHHLDEPLAPTPPPAAGASRPDVAEPPPELAEGYDLVLVEGAGGLPSCASTVPGGTLLDLAVPLRAEVVVVARAGLGTLNHTELTVAALHTAHRAGRPGGPARGPPPRARRALQTATTCPG